MKKYVNSSEKTLELAIAVVQLFPWPTYIIKRVPTRARPADKILNALGIVVIVAL